MPLPSWATEKSKVDVLDNTKDRKLAEQLKETIEREKSDPELSLSNTGITPDRSSVMQE
jgi:hypothetical protein